MEFADLFNMMMGMGNSDPSKYKEIRRLDNMLIQAEIPHYFRSHMGGFQITYFGPKGQPDVEPGHIVGSGFGAICSAIENPGSYGSEDDKIEISGLLTEEEYRVDSVKGHLTAEDVFERIKKHWIEATKFEDD